MKIGKYWWGRLVNSCYCLLVFLRTTYSILVPRQNMGMDNTGLRRVIPVISFIHLRRGPAQSSPKFPPLVSLSSVLVSGLLTQVVLKVAWWQSMHCDLSRYRTEYVRTKTTICRDCYCGHYSSAKIARPAPLRYEDASPLRRAGMSSSSGVLRRPK